MYIRTHVYVVSCAEAFPPLYKYKKNMEYQGCDFIKFDQR